jgi:hypothetical protein
MGMTLWMQTLVDQELSDESNDHSLLYEFAENLDAACEELGLAKLSSFFDTTDLELNMAEEFEDELDDEGDSGLPYGIDDMAWFDPAAGLACLEDLRVHVANGWNAELDADDRSMLLEEFDNCIEILKSLPAENARFHLAVIM